MFKPNYSPQSGNSFCEEGIDCGVFSEVYRRIDKSGQVPDFSISYFKYRNIKNTLRIRGDMIYIRISHLLREAPASVMSAIYEILLCRTFRLKGYQHANLVYNAYISSRDFLRPKTYPAAGSSRIKRNSPDGRVVNLGDRFIYLNHHYFDGNIRELNLHWVKRKSKRILGQFVPHRDEILINSILDHPLVPGSVVDFVLYHEMLHAILQPRISKTGRKTVHHGEFKKLERQFEGYAYANEFIKDHL